MLAPRASSSVRRPAAGASPAEPAQPRFPAFTGPSSGSVFLRNCEDCEVTVACRQFRMRDCARVRLHLYCATDPVIETSHHITFGCYNGECPGLGEVRAATARRGCGVRAHSRPPRSCSRKPSWIPPRTSGSACLTSTRRTTPCPDRTGDSWVSHAARGRLRSRSPPALRRGGCGRALRRRRCLRHARGPGSVRSRAPGQRRDRRRRERR